MGPLPWSLALPFNEGHICVSCEQARAAVLVVFPPCNEEADTFPVCSGCAEVAA